VMSLLEIVDNQWRKDSRTSKRNCYPSGAPEFTPGFEWGSCYSIFSFICIFCRYLVVLCCWPLCCLSFDLRILITHLISSNSSYINQIYFSFHSLYTLFFY